MPTPFSILQHLKSWVIVILIIAGGLGGVQLIHHAATSTRADGKPSDWAGDGIKCPNCGMPLKWQRRHEYRCSGCAATVDATYDHRSGAIEFHNAHKNSSDEPVLMMYCKRCRHINTCSQDARWITCANCKDTIRVRTVWDGDERDLVNPDLEATDQNH